MLYVFHVDKGEMMTLDMSLATECVQVLKEHVATMFHIPIEKQVLLISGGECLDSSKKVCSYSSGTDTNPIYLFSRSMFPAPDPQTVVVDFREEDDLLEKQIRYTEMPPSFQAVTKRAQLALQFAESATKMLRKCENLVLDQHNQQQGWAAVVANFDDVMGDMKNQFENLECEFMEYLQEREYFAEFLHKFKEALVILKKVPLLPKLLSKHNNETNAKMILASCASTSMGASSTKTANATLLDWIGRDDHDNDLETIYEECVMDLGDFNEGAFENIAREVANVVNVTKSSPLYEIGGLGPRLFTLDKLIQDTKRKVLEQNELAAAFNKNQIQAQNLMDPSILPDLCHTHVEQLSVMAANQKIIMEACRVCTKSKAELNRTLKTHLEWIAHTQNAMQKIGDHMDLFSENTANLRYRLGILEQVEMAPVAYLSYIVEIVRRRTFSQAFLPWASELACRLLTIHSEEVARRKEFQSKFENHFIKALFPGMDDQPNGYGIQAPCYFDTDLPKLTLDDIEYLKKMLPEMSDHLSVSPDTSYSTMLKSIFNNEKIEEQNILKLTDDDQTDFASNMKMELGENVGSVMTGHHLSHLKELDRGCDSETDTEEFEKLCQSPLQDAPSKPRTLDASTSTNERNVEDLKSECTMLKGAIGKIASTSMRTVRHLKNEIDQLRKRVCNDRRELIGQFETVFAVQKDVMSGLKLEESEERQLERRLCDYRSLEKEYALVKEENVRLKNESISNKQEIGRLEKKNRDDVQAVKTRFNMLMECSSSAAASKSCSIENHNCQLTEEMLKTCTIELEKLKMREKYLVSEAERYRDSVEIMLRYETDSHYKDLLEKVDELEKEKHVLDWELRRLRIGSDATSEMDQASSTEVMMMDSSTSPIRTKKSLSKSMVEPCVSKPKKIAVVDTLHKGDCVVIVWDEEHEVFRIVQDSKALYVLHPDSYRIMGLEVTEGPPKKPNKIYCLAEYEDREYCLARKSENRYKVQKGTRFFRVKVAPLKSPATDSPMEVTEDASEQQD